MSTPDYDTDFYAWTQAQAAAIRAGAWEVVDRTHLAEEVEDMGKSERRALVSHLRVLLIHLLKWEYQPARRSDSWVHSMGNAQVEVQTLLHESPSLDPDLPAFVTHAYGQACQLAARETGLSPLVFPGGCPWTPEQLLSAKFLDDRLAGGAP